MKIAVYCGSGFGNHPSHAAAAEMLGSWIGEKHHTLVYGGGESGLMGVIAQAAFEKGSQVIGVVPGNVEFIKNRPQPYVTELVITENMSSRKQKMLELADAFIALPGGVGTLDEITEAITLTKIGVFSKKSVLLNCEGFYEPLRNMIAVMCDADFLTSDDMQYVLYSDKIEEIETFLEA